VKNGGTARGTSNDTLYIKTVEIVETNQDNVNRDKAHRPSSTAIFGAAVAVLS
jgi:hypothetical protein